MPLDVADINITLPAPAFVSTVQVPGIQGTPGPVQSITINSSASVIVSNTTGATLNIGNVSGAFTVKLPNAIYLDDYVTSTGFGGGYGVVATVGSPNISLPAGSGAFKFTPAMNGASVYCSGFSNNPTPPTLTYVDPTHATLSANATGSSSYGRINVFQTGSDDTTQIRAAIAAAGNANAALVGGSRCYRVSSTIDLTGIQALVGQGDALTWFIPTGFLGIGSGSAPKGNFFIYANAPSSFRAHDFTIIGPGNKTPGYLTQMVMVGGVLTATVGNAQVFDANAYIRLEGARNAAFKLRATHFKTRSGGSAPTSSGFVADAVTWDNRPGYAAVSNVAITAGVINLTTSVTNFFETSEQVYITGLTSAAFLNSSTRYGIVSTNQGTTNVALTMPSWGITSVSVSGTTATYVGSFPSASFAGTTVTFSGFTNTGNNGAFVVTSSSSTQIVVTNASAVNETTTASVVITTYTSASDSGTIAYLQDGTYVDTSSGVHNYNGIEIWSHPAQANTITNRTCIERVNCLNFQGDGILWHQPNYAYVDRIECIGSSGGMSLASAYPTTGRFTNPSAFEVRGGNQLYGSMYGFKARAAAGLTIGMIGSNASGIAILLDGCSGVGASGLDLESETALAGQTDLWPGNHIELVGGVGIKLSGIFNYEGEQSNSTTPNSASQVMFYAWGGAQAFEYSNVYHCPGNGYVQQTKEIVVDSSCSGYTIENINLCGDTTNVSLAGSNYTSVLNGLTTRVSDFTGGLTLQAQQAATSGSNHQSPILAVKTTYWDGTQSQNGAFTFQAQPAGGTNPVETLAIKHAGSSGGSSLSYQNGVFTVSGTGNTNITNVTAATALANQNSPSFTLNGKYWDGSATQSDSWTSAITFGAGSNPVSTLTFSHTGTSGGGTFAIYSSALYAFTGAALTIGTGTVSTSTTTGAIILTGSAGMGIGGAVNAGTLTDSGNRVLTSLTPSGAGLSITGSAPALTISNTGVTSLTTNTGLSANVSATGAVTVTNTGVTSFTSSAGLSTNTSATGAVSVTNTGVTSLTTNTGLSTNTSATGSVTVTNTGVTSNVAGTGISVSGATGAVTIGNTGVLSLTQGATAGVTLSASTGAITIDTAQDIRTSAQPSFVGINLPGTAAITNAITSTTAATSGSNKSSPVLSIGGNYWNGSSSTADNFTLQATYAAGSNPIATLTFGHTGSSGGSAYSFNTNAVLGGNGNFTKIDGIVCVNAGVPIIQAKANLTAQTANVAATNITSTSTQSALYRISFYIVVSQAATSSSTLPDTTLIYTDRDSGATITIPMTAGKTTNTTSTYAFADAVINAASASNIQYAIGQNTAYASVGATAMQFAFRAISEYLG